MNDDDYEVNDNFWSDFWPNDCSPEALQLALTMKESGIAIRPTQYGFEVNQEPGRPHPIIGDSPKCCPDSKHWTMDDGDWVCVGCGAVYAQNFFHAPAQPSLAPLLPPTDLVVNGNLVLPPMSCCLKPDPREEDGDERTLCDRCGQEYFDYKYDEDFQKAIEAGSGFGTGGPTSGESGQSNGRQAETYWRNQADSYMYALRDAANLNHAPLSSGSITGSSDFQASTALTRRRRLLHSSRSEADLRALRDEDDSNLAFSLSGPSFNPILPLAPPVNDPTPGPSKPKARRAIKPPPITSNVPVRPRLPRYRTPTHCLTCMAEKGIRNMDCKLCHQCHSERHTTGRCKMLKPKFHKFMELSVELRQRIYALALDTDRPIRPHLCDYTDDQVVQFHDDNAEHHFATSDLLGITRVSKQVREESLPMFYSTNTFSIGYDTSTYFDRLAYLGRFHMVRHVRFQIDNRKESMSPSILRRMNQYIKEADVYEKQLTGPVGQHISSLKKHPQYLYGGCPELNTLITLMKLTSRLDNQTKNQYEGKGKGKAADLNTAPPFHSKLVVPVSSVPNFIAYSAYKWFPTVMYGLGIQLHYVDNTPFAFVDGGTVSITWEQRLQKKDFGDIPDYVDPVDSSGQTAAYKMALKLDPGLEGRQRPKAWAYLRETCTGGNSQWFDLPTEGGGVGY
ncbi:uncharacterized protein J4E79_005116 [Alternaria viburni]|uniref:uncharacterized protein n=1 Tax=Alternaria viburni TaxID=566460 RepID=UPI0020C524E2|nr:uncharacterized protein J4E79_005116 [Alternaria viburni]KAI4661303.1 hypothetical protein J4E79_005116 [Alternaria viburni]